MSKNPSTLRYLTAAKVPKSQLDKLSVELKDYAKNIQEIENSVNHAKRVAVISTYRSQLEALCKSAPDSRLFEEIYSSNLLLVGDLKIAGQMLTLCIQNGNTSIANFLFQQFPDLKKDEVMARIFTDTIKNNSLRMAQFISENNEFPALYAAGAFWYALENKETVNFLMPQVIRELEQESFLPDRWDKLNRRTIITNLRDAFYSDKLQILEYIFLNYGYIREISQEMLFDTAAYCLKDIEEYTASNNRCKFLTQFFNDSTRQKFAHKLNRKLSHIMSQEYPRSQEVTFLLELGADRLSMNDTGQIPLQVLLSDPIEKFIHMDGTYRHYLNDSIRKIVQILLSEESEAQTRCIDAEGNTVLHYPSAGIVIDLLEENGGNITRLNSREQTPLSAFLDHNREAFSKCNNDYWRYATIFIDAFKQYLYSTPITLLNRNKGEILNRLSILSEDNDFKKKSIKLIGEYAPHWFTHMPKQITNASFVATASKNMALLENPYNKYFSYISTFLSNPVLNIHGPLIYTLKYRKEESQKQPITNFKIDCIVDRMEDVD